MKRQVFFLLLFLLMGMSGCGTKEDNETESYMIGIAIKSTGSEYWMSVQSGIEKAAQDYGVKVRMVSPDDEIDSSMQSKMICDLIHSGVDALAVSPIRSDEADYLEEAQKAGIPVYAFDTKILDDDIPYIGIDNEKAGEILAEEMARQLGGKGNVGIISGSLDQTAHLERVDSIRKYLEENTEIKVSFIESGYANVLMTETEIAGLLQEYPQIDGIFVTSASTALGLAEYMENEPVKIMTIDTQQDAIEALKRGKIAALATQPGYEIGYEMIRYITEQKTKLPDKGNGLIIGTELLNSENVETREE